MLNNYLTVINAIDTFCANHANIHRFKSSFFEQIDDFSTSGNSFPIFYAVPNDIAMEENIDVMSFRIYCLDILQKDRVNEEAILNSTYQNLRDLVNWFRNDEFNDLNVLNSPRAIPVNNFLVDFTTGWYIDTELEVSVVTNDCAIPFTNNFQLTGTSCDVSYITPYLTCATVTGCTTLQEYVANQINNSLTGGTGGGFSGWTGSSGVNSIVANNGLNSIASGSYSIAGGTNNNAPGNFAIIGNGYSSLASGYRSSVLNGFQNSATTDSSTVINGQTNLASGTYSTVAGGTNNLASGHKSLIGNGTGNQVYSPLASILNGRLNTIQGTYSNNSVIGGGTFNVIGSAGYVYSYNSIIGAGRSNSALTSYSSVLNGSNNIVSSPVNGVRQTIVNGSYNTVSGGDSLISNGIFNVVTGQASAVISGTYNAAFGDRTVVIGGQGITGVTSETVYVPFLNVQSASTDNALTDVFVRDSTGEVKLRSVSSIAPVFSGATNFYAKFTSGGSISSGMISDNGISSSLSLASSGDNINVLIKSPAGFYYPSLTFANDGATTVGQITGYAGRLYTSPLSVGGTIDMGANKIINMAPGTNQDDAINLSQLSSNLLAYLNLSGGTVTGNTTFNAGLSATTLNVSTTANLFGNIFTSFSGSTNRIVEAGTTGALSATKDLIDSFLSAGTAATLLSTTSNWNASKVYTGTSITATYQGQQYYDANYYFVCVDDNDWIRIPRI